MTKKTGVLDTPPEDELKIVLEAHNNERVQELIAFGVDVNGRSEHDSYLAVAARAGNHVGVLRLLKAGAKVSRLVLDDAVRGGNARTADRILDELFYANIEVDMDVEMSQLLLQRGTTPLLNVPMLEWLAKQKVDLAMRSAHGNSLYDHARRDQAADEVIEFVKRFDDRAD